MLQLRAYPSQAHVAADADGVVFVNCHLHALEAVADVRLMCEGGPSVWIEMETMHDCDTICAYSEYRVRIATIAAGDDVDVLLKVEVLPAASEKLLQVLLDVHIEYTSLRTGGRRSMRSLVVVQRPETIPDDEPLTSTTLHDRHRIRAARALAMAARWTAEELHDTARGVLDSTSLQIRKALPRLTRIDAAQSRLLLAALEVARRRVPPRHSAKHETFDDFVSVTGAIEA
ncbi:hypothetical protein SPRG_00031 [Saprolegnia parasitica CBS 223.65]|uniref:Uncharacterized protein n=1 Tax=Saprolegnia parasitica (strain CBS 223.65) TaxID=695850 RepID=A0A067D144_SAPPC|nr:hypothetical protein SPRG_00031 [Saprolegnia parasitica CBS 223.65]KDO35185.1 hypothetical protein SPRG_00031 [Saprolegnia parasitica CBS 223.65]|eukprot:XP_012193537.1 hypothetical protein SPRG_00031 [Saprolegnia parasitica CBS 223.65]